MNAANMLSVGGLVIAVSIIAATAWRWNKDGRNLPDAYPFLGGLGMGAAWAACAGGVLAWISGMIAGGANKGGEAVMAVSGAGDAVMNTGTLGTLTVGGGVAVTIATAVGLIAFKAANGNLKRRMAGGLIAGCCLALTAGFAGIISSTVVPAANGVGDAVLNAFGGLA